MTEFNEWNHLVTLIYMITKIGLGCKCVQNQKFGYEIFKSACYHINLWIPYESTLVLSIFFSNATSKFDNSWTNLIENGYSDETNITGFNQDFEI